VPARVFSRRRWRHGRQQLRELIPVPSSTVAPPAQAGRRVLLRHTVPAGCAVLSGRTALSGYTALSGCAALSGYTALSGLTALSGRTAAARPGAPFRPAVRPGAASWPAGAARFAATGG
jgi:hypothetical protein